MSSHESNRLLGIAFLAIGFLQIFNWFVGIVGFSSLSGLMNIFMFSFLIYLFIAVLLIIAGFGILRIEPWAKQVGLCVSIFALIIAPVGTIAGIFGIWFLTSEAGKQLYSDFEENELESNSII